MKVKLSINRDILEYAIHYYRQIFPKVRNFMLKYPFLPDFWVKINGYPMYCKVFYVHMEISHH